MKKAQTPEGVKGENESICGRILKCRSLKSK
jgi:hypothetical protein